MGGGKTMRYFSILVLLSGLGIADTLTMRDGRQIVGSYLGGDARNVRVAIGDRVEGFRVEDILNITFGDQGAPPLSAPAPPPRREESRREEPRREEERRDQPPAGPSLASGTVLTVRMIDSIDSARDYVGKTFRASLDEPVNDVNGNPLIPRGADVVVKLVDDKQSGKIAGRTVLTLDLASVQVNGRMVDIDTETVTEQSASRTARSGKVIGGAAVLGTIVGAIAGGGKGAAIGAASGAGIGTAAEVSTKGQKVHIPSETRLTFTLQQPVQF
jgi:hypothetical protein